MAIPELRSIRRNAPVEPTTSQTPPAGSNGSATRPGSADSFERTGGASGSVSFDDGSVSVSGGVSAEVSRGPVTVGAGVEVEANLEEKVTREDGYVTFTVSAEASVTATGEVAIDGKKIGASASGSRTEGTNATYEVRLSEEDFEKLQAGELPLPNPLDPQTLPDGATVQLDQAQFEGTAFESTLSYHAAELGLSSSGSESEGTTLQVTRSGDSVQVTAGPTSVLSGSAGASLGVGPVSVSVGNTTELSVFELRTAEFDLGSTEGAEAYTRWANTGELPEADGPGVSNAGRIVRSEASSESGVEVDVGPFSVGHTGGNAGTRTAFIRADGSQVVDTTLAYGGGPLLKMHMEYDELGQRQYDKDSYELVFNSSDDTVREYVALAFTGSEEEAAAAAEADGPVTVSFGLHQLARLRSLARDFVAEYGDGGPGDIIAQIGASQVSNEEAAVLIASLLEQGPVASQFLEFASLLGDGDNFRNLPGSVDY